MWVEKTKNGTYKFCERYKQSGKLKRVCVTYSKNTASTRKKAIIELAEKIEIATGEFNTDLTLNDLLELYLHDRKDEVKESTYNAMVINLNSLKKYMNFDIQLSELNAMYINSKCKNVSRTVQVQLRAMLNYAYKYDYIDKDLGSKIKLNKAKKRNKKLYYERYELEEIFEKLEKRTNYTARMTRLVVEFLTLTGLRIGECLALTEDDVVDGVISVTKSVTYNKVHTPKTKSSVREFAINQRAKQIVAEAKMLKRMFNVNSEVLFASSKGEHIQQNSLRRELTLAGVSSRTHIYRHTHASLLAEEGISLDAIQRRLGHEKDDVTREIYVHVTEKLRKDEAKIFSNLEIL